jgi:hypothetical protein
MNLDHLGWRQVPRLCKPHIPRINQIGFEVDLISQAMLLKNGVTYEQSRPLARVTSLSGWRKILRGGFEISCQACSSSSKTLASFKSRVSKPSVNQP